jgi:hypothetical protein
MTSGWRENKISQVRVVHYKKTLLFYHSIKIKEYKHPGLTWFAPRMDVPDVQCNVSLYGWYSMPPTVHKILIHGADIIRAAIVPIGQLSEEAQESRNKDFKRFRANYTRKSSRKLTNEDLLNILLISSDPLISSLRKVYPKNEHEFFDETLDLINEEQLDGNDENEIEELEPDSENESE